MKKTISREKKKKKINKINNKKNKNKKKNKNTTMKVDYNSLHYFFDSTNSEFDVINESIIEDSSQDVSDQPVMLTSLQQQSNVCSSTPFTSSLLMNTEDSQPSTSANNDKYTKMEDFSTRSPLNEMPCPNINIDYLVKYDEEAAEMLQRAIVKKEKCNDEKRKMLHKIEDLQNQVDRLVIEKSRLQKVQPSFTFDWSYKTVPTFFAFVVFLILFVIMAHLIRINAGYALVEITPGQEHYDLRNGRITRVVEVVLKLLKNRRGYCGPFKNYDELYV